MTHAFLTSDGAAFALVGTIFLALAALAAWVARADLSDPVPTAVLMLDVVVGAVYLMEARR